MKVLSLIFGNLPERRSGMVNGLSCVFCCLFSGIKFVNFQVFIFLPVEILLRTHYIGLYKVVIRLSDRLITVCIISLITCKLAVL